jgi:hypothetical protein
MKRRQNPYKQMWKNIKSTKESIEDYRNLIKVRKYTDELGLNYGSLRDSIVDSMESKIYCIANNLEDMYTESQGISDNEYDRKKLFLKSHEGVYIDMISEDFTSGLILPLDWLNKTINKYFSNEFNLDTETKELKIIIEN